MLVHRAGDVAPCAFERLPCTLSHLHAWLPPHVALLRASFSKALLFVCAAVQHQRAACVSSTLNMLGWRYSTQTEVQSHVKQCSPRWHAQGCKPVLHT